MATSTVRSSLGGLARRLVADGLLGEADAIKAQQAAARGKKMLVSQLVEDKLIEPRAMAMAASEEFGVPYFDLDGMDMAFAPVKEVDSKLIQRLHALPLYRRGKRLFVAVSDPTNLQALDEMKFHTGINTEPILVEEDKLARALEVAGESLDEAMTGLVDEDLENIDIGGGEEDQQADITAADVDDAPVVRFVNKILLDAINRGASDVHFEPYERFYRIRFRQDGILHEIAQPPANLGMRLAARLKVMSRLDIAERRVPQDGRIKLKLSKTRAIDFRVSTCPTLWGEKVVLRILDPSSTRMGIDQLGYEPDQKELYLNALQRPQGMILVTGPTGSGKTVSLYTGLNILNTADRNISTAEDPAEINLPGVNQVNVNPKVGLTFAAAMRAFLRQDPDVIMVGEVRDLETAEIAIKAAQTGHMVLSTLHTNDAPQTLTRLVNMGVAPFNIASSVTLIIAQRLARRLCTHCKEPLDLPRDVLLDAGFDEDELDELKIYGP
ncbi:MAG TPA: type IV-A pilus assembly ATPase PilB, partial [Gammaproteobacteria bacterium]|nr:type IV-A pilus assembly ATPase PilB [Gammaproteobacteria bacterium]